MMMPIIRKTHASTIASQLVGVQPMTPPSGQLFTMRHGRVRPAFTLAKNQDACLKYPGEHYVVNVTQQVDAWLTDQPCDGMEHTLVHTGTGGGSYGGLWQHITTQRYKKYNAEKACKSRVFVKQCAGYSWE